MLASLGSVVAHEYTKAYMQRLVSNELRVE